MSELPVGWSTFTLADIGGLSGGKTPSKANPAFWSSRDIPWISPKDVKKFHLEDSEDRISEIALSDAAMALYPAGSILMVTRSGILQHTFPVAMASVAVTVNQDIKVIAPHDEIDTNFLLYSLRAFGQIVLQRCSKAGTTVQSIDSEKLEAMPLPLPPLTEQKRIAQKLNALLDQVDTLKARIDAIPALLKRFRQSILSAATTGKLTQDWRESAGGAWRDTTVGEVCASSFYGPRFGKDEYTREAGGIPTIRTTDMTDDGRIIVTANTPRVLVPKDKIEKFRAERGDLLVTRTGSIGVMAVFDGDYECIPSAYLIRFRFKREITPRYAFFCLMSPAGQAALGLSATAITQPNINAESIKAIDIQLPQADEQAEIIRRVEQLFSFADQLEAKVVTAKQRIDTLTQSILAKAFSGELVPQDPNDEPASVLLERIRAQRAAAPKPKRGRKPISST